MTSLHGDSIDELRVLHWNVHSWQNESGASNLEAVAEVVRKTDPHVVSLVEVDESWDRGLTLDELARQTGYQSFFVPVFEFGDSGPAGGFGNALLSRVPVASIRQRQLLWPPRLYERTEQSESRCVVLAGLRLSAGLVWIGSTHLPRNELSSRMGAAQRLIHIMRGLPEPWLVVGDFNMPATQWLKEYPEVQFSPRPETSTYPTGEPVEAIDYCISEADSIVQTEVLPEEGSDHLPVLVRYQALQSQAARSSAVTTQRSR